MVRLGRQSLQVGDARSKRSVVDVKRGLRYADTLNTVFWWFERKGRFLRYEARETHGMFEFCIVDPDGTERVETFTDSRELARRQAEFEDRIKADGWTGPHGWNL